MLEVSGWALSHSEAVFAFLAGVLIKTFLDLWRDNRLAERNFKRDIEVFRVKVDEEKNNEAKLKYYVPLHRAISAFVNRMNIAFDDAGGNYGYSREYIISTFWFEFCLICYWLDRPYFETSLNDKAFSPHHESALRDALSTITGIPSYSQKIISSRMATEVEGKPKTIEEFAEQYSAIMDVELLNGGNPIDLFHPIRKNLVDRLHELKIDKIEDTRRAVGNITWLMLKSYDRAYGTKRLKVDRKMLDTADRSLKRENIAAAQPRQYRRSLPEILSAMPDAGTDADFDRDQASAPAPNVFD